MRPRRCDQTTAPIVLSTVGQDHGGGTADESRWPAGTYMDVLVSARAKDERVRGGNHEDTERPAEAGEVRWR